MYKFLTLSNGIPDRTPLANLVSTAGLGAMFAGMEDWLPMTIGIIVGTTAIVLNVVGIFAKTSEIKSAKLSAMRQQMLIDKIKDSNP